MGIQCWESFTSLLLIEALTCRMVLRGVRDGIISAEVTSLGWQARTGAGDRQAGVADRHYIKTKEITTKLGWNHLFSWHSQPQRSLRMVVIAYSLALPSLYHLSCKSWDPPTELPGIGPRKLCKNDARSIRYGRRTLELWLLDKGESDGCLTHRRFN